MRPNSRLVTTERDGYFAIARHRGRMLVRTKFMHENNPYKPPPENLRGTTRIYLLVIQTVSRRIFVSRCTFFNSGRKL